MNDIASPRAGAVRPLVSPVTVRAGRWTAARHWRRPHLHVHLERLALDDRRAPARRNGCRCGAARARWRGRAACPGTRRRGRARRSTASRRRRATNCSRIAGQPRRAVPTGPSTFVLSKSCADASTGVPSSWLRHEADGVEILEREPDRVHQPVALDAVGAHAMVQHLLAHRRFLRIAGGIAASRPAAAERRPADRAGSRRECWS